MLNGHEILLKAEENVNITAAIPFAERLEKSLMPKQQRGEMVFLTESEQVALEIGKELLKAYSTVSDDDEDEDDEAEPENDDGGFGAATEGDDDDAEGD